ncbi:MAG: GTP cyclohydrolase I FolE [Planctomycetes bacterium]|nr:GTP cyclohydrolase I FolE [Planctomycetota bacterium]MBI3846312.1 GTP cyclohydrolase I FolE [Planctomycetota bacterium]
MNRDKLIAAGRMILEAIGEDPEREGLKKTPERIAKMYEEVFSGLNHDPREIVGVLFNERYDEVVLVKDICFTSMCEHHLLPFVGKAHCAYLPNGRVLGISKLARVVDLFARRPQVQERLTNQIAELIEEMAQPRGVAVVLEASHTCMTIRGVKKAGSRVITSAVRGIFRESGTSRAEVMTLIHESRSGE